MSVNSGASKSMFSFTISVGIGSKSHVLVVDVRTMRVPRSRREIYELLMYLSTRLSLFNDILFSVTIDSSIYVSHFTRK